MNISKNNDSSEPIKIEYFNPKKDRKLKIYAKRNFFCIETFEYEKYLDKPSTFFLDVMKLLLFH